MITTDAPHFEDVQSDEVRRPAQVIDDLFLKAAKYSPEYNRMGQHGTSDLRIEGVTSTFGADVVDGMHSTEGSFYLTMLEDPFSTLKNLYERYGNSSIEVGALDDELVSTLSTPDTYEDGRPKEGDYYQACLVCLRYCSKVLDYQDAVMKRDKTGLNLFETSRVSIPSNAASTLRGIVTQLLTDLLIEPVETRSISKSVSAAKAIVKELSGSDQNEVSP